MTGRVVDGYRRATPPVPSPSGLTAREEQVLRLVAGGLSNSEIADALSITEATVSTHLNRLLAKLSLRDRAQAVRYAYESGIDRALMAFWVRPAPRRGTARARRSAARPGAPTTTSNVADAARADARDRPF
ncbi:response regulator transcription factor [Nonomuraea sp. 3N208]|uniref:response regulator transcription factor n=1 Tax=Nonomuraea sp. 3N208 TaxID=3457421 RepID=UPI003FCD4B3D